MKESITIPESTASEIFTSASKALKYLEEEDLIPSGGNCLICTEEYRWVEDGAYLFGGCFRCSNSNCKSRKVIFENKKINKPLIPIHKKFLAVYEILNDDYQKRIMHDCKIAKSTVQTIKKDINLFFEEKTKHHKNMMLGGKNSVQIDETLVSKGKYETCPSNLSDDIKGGTWLVGIIEANTGNMIIEIVPNRKIETLTALIQKHVFIGTLIITDGYPSYPAAVRNCFCSHEIVNHSRGFKNKRGFHTNNIESLWSQMKYYEKKDSE